MEPESPVWLNVFVTIIFFGGLFGVGFFLYSRQQRILNRVAEKLELDYEEGGTTVVSFPSEKAIPRKGRFIQCLPEVRWRLSGEIEGVEVCVYKMYLRTGSSSDPKSRTWGYPYLVGHFILDGMNLPQTLIRPRSFIGRVRHLVGGGSGRSIENHLLSSISDITTDSEAEFIRVFDEEAGRFYETRKKMTLEGLANSIHLFEKPSQIRFLFLTESSLEAFIQWGVKLTKQLE
ncbi:MAG: hypothetical protein KC940_00915 [Candidatus Omnitrophica bacterium]|nr:hypothetical protein [Candidatus Omnitrophota bacterium]